MWRKVKVRGFVGCVVFAGWTLAVSQSLAASVSTNSPASLAGTNALPRLIDFGCGDKCLPCKMMLPILEDLKNALTGRLDVVSIDVWEHPAEKAKYRIITLPTQVFFDADGKEIYRHMGFFPREDVLKKWQELGVNLGTAAGNPPSKAR